MRRWRISSRYRSTCCTKRMENSDALHWENCVRFARRKLIDLGVIDPSEHGRWKLVLRTEPKVWVEKSLVKGRPDRTTGPDQRADDLRRRSREGGFASPASHSTTPPLMLAETIENSSVVTWRRSPQA